MQESLQSLAEFILFLMPGFVAAWIMYGLTSHPKPSQFERLIQALILTAIIQSLMPLAKYAHTAICIESSFTVNKDLWSLIIALVIGLLLALFINKDWFHAVLRKVGFTSRTSHPSEWFYVFSQKITFIVIHLKDGRRIYGWPKEWPINPKTGQVYLMEPIWLSDDGKEIADQNVDGILIDSNDIRFVEFMKNKWEQENE